MNNLFDSTQEKLQPASELKDAAIVVDETLPNTNTESGEIPYPERRDFYYIPGKSIISITVDFERLKRQKEIYELNKNK